MTIVLCALSIRQPYAWAMTDLDRRLDNREWSTDYRGWVLLHASKTMGDDDYYMARSYMHDIGATKARLKAGKEPVPYRSLPRDAFVGVARLTDVLRPADEAHEARVMDRLDMDPLTYENTIDRWWLEGHHGLVFDEVRKFSLPVPGKATAPKIFPVEPTEALVTALAASGLTTASWR